MLSLERERPRRERIPLNPTALSLNPATDLAFFSPQGAGFLCPVAVCVSLFVGSIFCTKSTFVGPWLVGHSLKRVIEEV